jgi:hypothetical protein
MALTDIVAPWQKQNTSIWLTTAIGTAPSSTATFVFRNIGAGPWPKSGKPLNEYDHQQQNFPLRDANDYKLGIVRPEFSVELPFTPTTLAFGLISLLQNKTGATNLLVIPYTDPNAKLFFGMATGFGGAVSYREVYGGIVRSLTIAIPPADASGGHPTLKLDCIAAYAARNFSGMNGTMNTDKPCLSSEWGFLIGGVAKKFTGAEITITNNAALSPHTGANADMINLGKLDISGNVGVAVSNAASDEWDAINDAYEAGSSIDFRFDLTYEAVTHTIKLPVVFLEEPPEPAEQSGVAVSKIPFKGIYKDADEPGFTLTGLASAFAAWE